MASSASLLDKPSSPQSQTTECSAAGTGGNKEQLEGEDNNDLVGKARSPRLGTATLRYQGPEHRTRANRSRLST